MSFTIIAVLAGAALTLSLVVVGSRRHGVQNRQERRQLARIAELASRESKKDF